MKMVVLTAEQFRSIVGEVLDEKLHSFHKKENLSTRHKKRYIGIKELSEELDLPVSTIYGMTHRRIIPFIKRGKRLLFDMDEISKWLETGKRKIIKL